MELFLIRGKSTATSTPGQLETSDEFICYTLEDVVRAPGVKVKDETAIPAGRYEVMINFSNRFQRLTPRLLNVPGFSGILVHEGNRSSDSSGCILVGNKRAKDSVYESKDAYKHVYQVIEAGLKKGKVWLTVK